MRYKLRLSGAALLSFFLAMAAGNDPVLAKTFYLDGNLAANCTSGNYSAANRNCSGTDGEAYKSLADAIPRIAGGDTLYVRASTYIRTTNSHNTGALTVEVSGSPAQHTVVKNYNGEQPIICTAIGKCQYNPTPNATATPVCYPGNPQGGGNCYYPNPAISVGGSYIDIIGLKTYGQVLIGGGNNITIQNCDIGGGGPRINQGSVLMIDPGPAYDIIIRNNRIHNSVWGESSLNGSALMGYRFHAIVENNEFYDNVGCDVRFKDVGGQSGRTAEVRFNMFRPSTSFGSSGVCGGNQQMNIDRINIRNNIFFKKTVGVSWDVSPTGGMYAYNNTFVDCGKDLSQWLDSSVYSYNNLHYHSSASASPFNMSLEGVSVGNIKADFNLYFATSTSPQWRWKGAATSSVSTWRSSTGQDMSSLAGSDPRFANAAGEKAEDFKRLSYVENITGSPYGSRAGAYETGAEFIGVDWTRAQDTVPPAAPLNLRRN